MSHLAGGLCLAFSIEGRKGNPALVLVSEGQDNNVDDVFCARLSADFGYEVTWVQQMQSSSPFALRYFNAGAEIGFCGHGTLAAAAWLARFRGTPSPISFLASGQTVTVEQTGPDYWAYRQAAFDFDPISDASVACDLPQALGLQGVGAPVAHAIAVFRTQGALRNKLVVAFADHHQLADIHIRAALRDSLCDRLQLTGVYAFARVSEGREVDLLARHFPIHASDQEDMATAAIAPSVARHVVSGAGTSAGVVRIFQGGKQCDQALLVVSQSGASDVWHVGGQVSTPRFSEIDKMSAD